MRGVAMATEAEEEGGGKMTTVTERLTGTDEEEGAAEEERLTLTNEEERIEQMTTGQLVDLGCTTAPVRKHAMAINGVLHTDGEEGQGLLTTPLRTTAALDQCLAPHPDL